MYIYWRINDDSESIFDADQHPEVHLAGNDYQIAHHPFKPVYQIEANM